MERVMGVKLSTWAVGDWKARYRSVRLRYLSPPHLSQWWCIHRYEGAWNDPNAPYWGGLQMDVSFMATYGNFVFRHKGTADHWTPIEQMWAAEHALWAGRGFYPWPNTAKACGYI